MAEFPASANAGLVASVDVGADVVVSATGDRAASAFAAVLVPNEISSTSTPCWVTFPPDGARGIGDAGKQQARTSPKVAATGLTLLLLDDGVERVMDDPAVACAIPEGYRPAHALGAMLGAMKRHAERAAASAPVTRWVLAAPPAAGEAGKARLLDAAIVAGLGEDVDVVDAIDAAASAYAPLHRAKDGEAPKRVLIVDVGFAFTAAAAYELPADGAPVRLSIASAVVGARDLDIALWGALADELRTKHGVDVTPHTKAARKLMDGVTRAKKVLSTIPNASVDLECFGEAERDYQLPVTRAAFEAACAAPVAAIAQVVADAVRDAGEGGFASIEGIGGATRVPCVVDAVAAAAGTSPPLSRMLDSASCVAQGAVYIAQADPADRPFAPAKAAPVVRTSCTEEARAALRSHPSRAPGDELAAHVLREAEMAATDDAFQVRGEAYNALEAYVLQTKGAIGGGPHGAKLEPARGLLDAEEDWLYGEEAESASAERLEDRRRELVEAVEKACPEYFAAVREEKERVEAALKAEAEAEAARVAVEGREDHDQRKLRFPDRMKKVQLNKSEGTELFKDGNMVAAIDRWDKALAHCDKFFDLNDDQQAEVTAVKLSLELNKAQGWLKVGGDVGLKKAEDASTKALELDAGNAKALYRRALAREKTGKYAEAREDLLAVVGQEDAAVVALLKRVDAQIARQAKKEKAMFGKMFG